MEERNVHTFRNGAETRTLEFGRLSRDRRGVREEDRQGRHHPVLLRRARQRRASAAGREARRARSTS